MACMTCGKKATKTKSYSAKAKSSTYRSASASPFGQPKVLKGFSSRNR